jgi:hypothetical protein
VVHSPIKQLLKSKKKKVQIYITPFLQYYWNIIIIVEMSLGQNDKFELIKPNLVPLKICHKFAKAWEK